MSASTYTAGIYTLGCKVNQYESEAIAEALAREGVCVLPPTEICDAYIINTCTVTAESDRKARQFIRRAISRNPYAVIVVTGCLAQTSPDSLRAIAGVHAIVGNAEKMQAATETLRLLRQAVRPAIPSCSVSDLASAPFEPMAITTFERTRAYIKIEDGCESRCTYCIIPSARGPIRSKPMADVIDEVRVLTAGGCREVVLTGIETASWGKDLADGDLASLLAAVDGIEGIGRVRLGSLDPSLIRQDFVDKIAPLASLAPHFHLSLQSGSSRILAKMKRKYNAEQAMRAITLLRENIKGVQFTTDVIVGFPGETEKDFAETLDFVRRARFLNVHVFPYSKRQGTPAATMPDQVSTEEKNRRLHILTDAVREIRKELLQEAVANTPTVTVLFESMENGQVFGHTANFIEVAVPSDRPLHGELCEVSLLRADDTRCYGELKNTDKT